MFQGRERSQTMSQRTCEERARLCNFSNIFLPFAGKLSITCPRYDSKQSTVVQVQPQT